LAERHKRREEELDRAKQAMLAPAAAAVEAAGVACETVILQKRLPHWLKIQVPCKYSLVGKGNLKLVCFFLAALRPH
jgi:hypothetical protein